MRKLGGKLLVLVIAVLFAVPALSGLTACERQLPPGGGDYNIIPDPKKIQIYLNVYNGGIGMVWINNLAAEFNASEETYQIIPVGRKDFDYTAVIRAGDKSIAADFNTSSYRRDLINEGLYEDLSPLLDRRPDGPEGLTIREKLLNADDWMAAASKRNANGEGEGLYMLPCGDGFLGLVYDHDMFRTYLDASNPGLSWLYFAPTSDKSVVEAAGLPCEVLGGVLKYTGEGTRYYNKGDIVLRAGKDGKYGTYDDGQPETLDEFMDLIDKIKDRSVAPFIYYNNYVGTLGLSVFAQYAGVEAYRTAVQHDSQGAIVQFQPESPAGIEYPQGKAITLDEGYLTWQMDGLQHATDFLSMIHVDANKHTLNKGSIPTHTMTQDYFVTGTLGTIPGNQRSAFMNEGTWWENEARVILEDTKKSYPESNFGYGNRDYRYMLLPDFDGQSGIDGEGHGTVFPSWEEGSIVVQKINHNNPAEVKKLNTLLDFIEYTLTDEALRMYTRETGAVRPFKYSLTAEDRQVMSKFGQCVNDIYFDNENTSIIHTRTLAGGAGVSFTMNTIGGSGAMASLVDGTRYENAWSAFRAGKTTDRIVSGMWDRATTAQWAKVVEDAKSRGLHY